VLAGVRLGRTPAWRRGDTPPYAVAREVEDLAALLDAAGGSTAVVGFSSGTAIAPAEAVACRLSVNRLILWEPPFSTDPDGPAYPSQPP
jgi:pimeloyl-ACP methyl ester carboxylesterase